jgi:hypothetical protein
MSNDCRVADQWFGVTKATIHTTAAAYLTSSVSPRDRAFWWIGKLRNIFGDFLVYECLPQRNEVVEVENLKLSLSPNRDHEAKTLRSSLCEGLFTYGVLLCSFNPVVQSHAFWFNIFFLLFIFARFKSLLLPRSLQPHLTETFLHQSLQIKTFRSRVRSFRRCGSLCRPCVRFLCWTRIGGLLSIVPCFPFLLASNLGTIFLTLEHYSFWILCGAQHLSEYSCLSIAIH